MIRYVIDSFFAEQSCNSNKKINNRFVNNKKHNIMRKQIFTFLLAVLCCTSINAQIGGEMGFRLDVPYNNAHTTPLVRSVDETTIVAYYEHSFRGVFVVMEQGNLTPDTIELPHYHYVYDFELMGNMVYFCGKVADTSDVYDPKELALIGNFDISPFLNNGTTTTIKYKKFDLVEGKDHNKLKKMVAYKDTQDSIYILAIGESFLCDTTNQPCHSGLDFFISINMTSNSIPEIATFATERYHDIIETDNHVVLVGGDISGTTSNNAVCFRRIRKYNIQSPERDELYLMDSPNIEPSTFVYGTQIEGSDRFITSTFGHVNGFDGSVIRTFNASDMEMLHAQFIPSMGEKTQPYELCYVPETEKVLLLQLSTENPATRIYNIDPYATQNYTTTWEYHPSCFFHSLNMYQDDEYIAMGLAGQTLAFYARNVLYDGFHCVNKVNVDVEMIDILPVQRFDNYPLNIDFQLYDDDSSDPISSQRVISLECY